MAPDADRFLATLGRRLADAGIDAVALPAPGRGRLLDLLVRRADAGAAAAVIGAGPWWLLHGADGAGRLTPVRAWRFPGGWQVVVRRRLRAAPLPGVVLRRLEAELRRGAARRPDGLLEPPAAAALVYAAFEAARGRLRGEAHAALVRERAAAADPAEAATVARRAGVFAAYAAALAWARHGGPAAPPPLWDDRAPALAWPVARRARRAARPRALRGLLAGDPRGHAPVRVRFDGLELRAGPGTFLPRPESSALVAAAAGDLAGGGRTAVDVGTGCGAVALAVAARHPGADVHGIELDAGAAAWARRNARRLGLPVAVHVGSLLEPLPEGVRGAVDVVVANMPCIPTAAWGGAADAPAAAYVGVDDDGLGLQRRLAGEALGALRPGGLLAIQMSPPQWEAFAPALRRLGYAVEGADVRSDAVAVGRARTPARTRPRA